MDEGHLFTFAGLALIAGALYYMSKSQASAPMATGATVTESPLQSVEQTTQVTPPVEQTTQVTPPIITDPTEVCYSKNTCLTEETKQECGRRGRIAVRLYDYNKCQNVEACLSTAIPNVQCVGGYTNGVVFDTSTPPNARYACVKISDVESCGQFGLLPDGTRASMLAIPKSIPRMPGKSPVLFYS